MPIAKLKEYLQAFPDAILTGVDVQGYPVSVRCHPRIDKTGETLLLHLPPDIQIIPGLAGLLCHSHDEKLWHLKSFALQGNIDHQDEISLFHVQRLLPGMNMAGAPGPLATIIRGRRRMKHILQKRGQTPPTIPWQRMKQIADTAE